MLGSRIATAVVLLLAFAAALVFAPRWLWIALCTLVLAAAAWEWGRLARLAVFANGAYVALLVAAVLCALLLASDAARASMYGVSAAFWVVAAPLWLWRRPPPGSPVWPVLTGVLALPPAFVALVGLRDGGAGLLLAVMAIAWVSDTAAYFTGRRLGRHKLAPRISPGKTWEGFWGAMVAVALYGLLIALSLPRLLHGHFGTAGFIALALGLAVLGVLGDLFESQLKRSAGVKDSGTLLPGHGGVLDRIDALLPIVPAAALAFGQ